MYLGITKHFWLIDNLIFYNTLFVSWFYQLRGGKTFPCPNLETVCLHPPPSLCGRPCTQVNAYYQSVALENIECDYTWKKYFKYTFEKVFVIVFKMLYKHTLILALRILLKSILPNAGCSPSCLTSPESLLTFLRKTTGAFAGSLNRSHRASFSQTSHLICSH